MNRQNFIRTSAATALTACCGLETAARPAANVRHANAAKRTGIQLYSYAACRRNFDFLSEYRWTKTKQP